MSQTSLPAGWFSSVDATSGHTYYFTETGVTQWTVPTTPYFPPPSKAPTYQSQPNIPQPPTKPLTPGQRALQFFWEIAFYPFTGRFPGLTFLIAYLVIFLIEFISGCCGGKIFIGVWLIFNALVMALDVTIHYFTMRKTVQYFLTPTVPVDITQFAFSPSTILNLYFPNISDPTEQRHRNFVTFRMFSFVIIRLFQLIWTFAGSIALGSYHGHRYLGGTRVMATFSLILTIVSFTVQIGFFVALKWVRKEFSDRMQAEPLQHVSPHSAPPTFTPVVPVAYAQPQSVQQEPEDEKTAAN